MTSQPISMNDLIIASDTYFREVIEDWQNALERGEYGVAAYLEDEAAHTMRQLADMGVLGNDQTDD